MVTCTAIIKAIHQAIDILPTVEYKYQMENVLFSISELIFRYVNNCITYQTMI